jgi:hypothetical protein
MTKRNYDPLNVRGLDKSGAMQWLLENDGMNASISYVREYLTYESIGGRVFADSNPQNNRPHVLVVADTSGYVHVPLARAAVAASGYARSTFLIKPLLIQTRQIARLNLKSRRDAVESLIAAAFD